MREPSDMEAVYERCKEVGIEAVAVGLGMSRRQLVAQLYQAGVMGEAGSPSRKEIAERCRDVQRSWDDERRLAPGDDGRVRRLAGGR